MRNIRVIIHRAWKPALAAGFVAGLLMGVAPPAGANTPEPNIFHGRMWTNVGYDGADGWDAYYIYPGGLPVRKGQSDYVMSRQWNTQTRKGGTYLMSTDFTDPNGTAWPNAVSYMFRSMDYSYPFVFNGAFNYVWPLGMVRNLRWDRPQVVINDTLSIDYEGQDGDNANYPSYGNDPRPPFSVHSDLVTEMENDLVFRYVQGVKITRRVYSYPQGSPHQDYILFDITLKNDGIVGDPDALPGTHSRISDTTGIPGIPQQTINHMLWWHAVDQETHAGADVIGDQALRNDQNVMYIQPWPGVDNTVAYAWDEDAPLSDGPDYGDPSDETSDFLLLGNAFVMEGPVFVSTGPGADYNVNLTGQPLFREVYHERGFDLAGKEYSPVDMDEQRSFATDGTLQLAIGESYETNDFVASVRDDPPGPTYLTGYGPSGGDISDPANAEKHGWNVPPGDSVRIVKVTAIAGIDQEEGRRIGQYWNTQKAASKPPADWMTQADIDLYFTGADSARKAVNLAYWNYWGHFAPGVTVDTLAKWGIPGYVMSKPAAYDQPFNVPDPPRPPGKIMVNAPDDGGITISWTREAESAPDHDTGVNDFAGYRVWRQDGSRLSPWHVISAGNNWAGDATTITHRDLSAQPGVNYWYAVTAYDDGTQNWANPGVSLESGRWWTWTGMMPGTAVTPKKVFTAVNARPDAYKLAIRNNVPNPFNPSTVINYSLDKRYDQVSLKVYDILGREVRTLVDQKALSAGLHQVTWDGADAVGRGVGSGIYVARLITPNGTRSIRMLLVR